MKKIIVPVMGMHCKACEMLIEEQLSAVPGVKRTAVSVKQGTAEVYFEDNRKIDEEKIHEAIREAGYSVGSEKKKPWFSRDIEDYKDLGIAFFWLAAIFMVFKILDNLGMINFNFGTSSANPSGLPVVFLVGITAGLSTCMALVGGLVLGISGRHAEKHPEATALKKFRPHIFFNVGRILFFALFGGILGSLGSFVQLSGFALGIMTIAVGAVMLLMGLQLIEIFPIVSRAKITLPKSISRMLGIKNHTEEYSHRGSFVLGGLTFFLPCGFTQAMQLFAISTGSFLSGALVMGVFALGTAPGLLGIGGLTSLVKGIFAKRFFKFAGILVIAFSFFNIANGYNLTGWQIGNNPTDSQTAGTNDPNVKLENGVQVVRMKELAQGYAPNKFTIKKGVPVRWVIDAQAPFSCANTIMVPKLNITKRLVKGENIIEFTAKEAGALKFSCSMGMYTGVFNVVDESGKGADAKDLSSSATKATGGTCSAGGAGGSGGGCGGGAQIKKDATDTIAKIEGNVQTLNAVYTLSDYLKPNSFKVKLGVKVKLTIDVKDSGRGCGYAIMISGLYNNAIPLQAGKSIVMEFTPTTRGNFDITCGMGMINYGTIVVE